MILPAAAAALVAGAVSSATGFGFALVLSPVLFALLDPHEAVTTTLLVALMLNLLNLFDTGLVHVRWRAVAPALAAALPGLVVGVVLLELLSKPVLQLGVGVIVMAAALAGFSAAQPIPREPSLASAGTAGLASGVLATSVGVSGPPLVVWFQAHGLNQQEFRSSLAVSFLGLSLAGGVAVLSAGGGRHLLAVPELAVLIAATLSGWRLGAQAFRRLDPARFRTLVQALLLATGAASVAAGAFAL